MRSAIQEKTARFPDGPGIYVFLDSRGKALYVGKASNLKARVRSYLRSGGDGRPFLRFLEHEAEDVEFVATGTEQEALLLENTVIKKRRPRYNIKLRDDKAFLMLRLDRREEWPWYRLVRRRSADGADYFGPYASAKSVRRTLRLLHKVVPLRDCSEHVFHNRSRPCIKHQIGRCPAPCVGLIDHSAYEELLERSVRILRGDARPVLDELRAQMERAAEELQFERAQALKLQIEALQSVAEKQAVVAGEADQDAVGLQRVGEEVTAVFLLFRRGSLESSRRFRFRSELLGRFYEGDRYVPREVLVPGPVAEQDVVQEWLRGKRGSKVEIAVPQRGVRRRHLDMAVENARLTDAMQADEDRRRAAGAERLAEILGTVEAPERIHCLDVSTMQGSHTVASRVSFVAGRPHKDGYRHFRISPANAGDDFAAMQEAVRRSLTLCLEREDGELPDLLLVDGGRGQLGAARKAVAELGLPDDLCLAGLAKSRLKGVGAMRAATGERLFLPDREAAVPLPADGAETLLVAAVRDEAHRFAITYHRKRRSRLTSALDDVPGVGPERRRLLLRHFGSLSKLRAAEREAIRGVPGIPANVADAVFESLRASAR